MRKLLEAKDCAVRALLFKADGPAVISFTLCITMRANRRAQVERAPVRMIDPTCWPRSAAVSRPGTRPFTTCTRSMCRAFAMTSISARSNGWRVR